MNKTTVLSVDDDESLQIVLRHYLEEEGYNVLTAGSGDELFSKLVAGMVDVILLDLVLPDSDGLTLMRQVRGKTTAPIIVVSGKGEASDRIIGLELGADDYLVKPFEMRELSARIKAVLRRMKIDAANSDRPATIEKCQTAAFNGLILDRKQQQVFDSNNKSLELTAGEFSMLEALVLTPHVVMSREQLFDLTRQGTFSVYDRMIDIQIGRIRKKLKNGGGAQAEDLIKTVRGAGYKFIGDPEYK